MSDNDNENLDSTNETTEEVVNTDEVEETDDQSESEDLEVIKEKNKRLFERAKKAEAEAKLLKAERLKQEEQAKVKKVETKTESSEKQGDFDLEDVAVLVQKVSDKEDRDMVKDYAKFKKISLEDALKNNVIQAELKNRAEERTTAQATNTNGGRRGSTKPTPEQILANAAQGKLPDDPAELAEARAADKKKK